MTNQELYDLMKRLGFGVEYRPCRVQTFTYNGYEVMYAEIEVGILQVYIRTKELNTYIKSKDIKTPEIPIMYKRECTEEVTEKIKEYLEFIKKQIKELEIYKRIDKLDKDFVNDI